MAVAVNILVCAELVGYIAKSCVLECLIDLKLIQKSMTCVILVQAFSFLNVVNFPILAALHVVQSHSNMLFDAILL